MGRRHWIVASGGTLAALLIGAGAASAHIDPDPVEVQAGLPVTVEFRDEEDAIRVVVHQAGPLGLPLSAEAFAVVEPR